MCHFWCVPLDPKIRRGGDAGRPIVVEEPDSVYASHLPRHVCQARSRYL